MMAIVKPPEPISLKWLTDKPIWIEQWPLSKEKLEALEKLVTEQVENGHIAPTFSPWNSPVFVIKKKSGKWRMLTDLRAINSVIQLNRSITARIAFSCYNSKKLAFNSHRFKRLFLYYPLSLARL